MTEKDIQLILEKARRVVMTPGQDQEQRRSFAYGNAKIENERVTRAMVDEADSRLAGMGVAGLPQGSPRLRRAM